MRHGSHSHRFHRRGGPHKALLKGLVISLVEHGRICTTLTKAKELRRHVEKAVTIGKAGDLAARRLLKSRFGNDAAVETLVGDLGKRFKARKGGYTRVVRLGPRPGDMAPMALIEFVDYKLPETAKGGEATVKGDATAEAKAKARARAANTARKRVRKIQAQSRRDAR